MWLRRGLCILLLLPAGAAAAEPLRIGTTFSPRQCVYLRLDPKHTLKEILKADFDLIRFAAYWDEIEPEDGTFDFSALDWQIEQAAARQIPVVLSVGVKAPRWPEYFIPSWLLKDLRLPKGSDIAKNANLRKRALRFIEAVVRRYRHEDVIQYWQVDNEPMDRVGAGYWWMGPKFVEEEVALVRKLDPRARPVLLTTVTYPDPLLRRFMYAFISHDTIHESLKMGDLLGINVYPVVGHRWLGKKSYYWTSAEERNEYLGAVMKRAERAGKQVWVTELQAEPWEPDALVYTDQAHPPTADPALLRQNVEEVRVLGITTILLWGAEYWQFRKARYRDSAWWDEVRALLRNEHAAAAAAVAH